MSMCFYIAYILSIVYMFSCRGNKRYMRGNITAGAEYLSGTEMMVLSVVESNILTLLSLSDIHFASVFTSSIPSSLHISLPAFASEPWKPIGNDQEWRRSMLTPQSPPPTKTTTVHARRHIMIRSHSGAFQVSGFHLCLESVILSFLLMF